MADIPNPTLDVTIWDAPGTYSATVNSNNELLTHDTHVYSDGDRSQWAVKDGREYLVITPLTTISGTAETDFMLVINPTGTGKIAYIEDLVYTASKGGGIFKMYRNPTITANGTAQTIVKIKPSSANNSVVTPFFLPTISARGTLTTLFNLANPGSELIHFDLARMIEPTYSILITIAPGLNNTDHSIFLSWEEQ